MELLSLDEARATGAIRYFTGLLCKRGHQSPRLVSTRVCLQCKVEHERAAYQANPEVFRQKTRDYIARDPQAHRDRVLASIRKDKAAFSARRSQRKKDDPVHALSVNTRRLVALSLSKRGFGKSSKTQAILGCSWPEFAAHIERQLLPGMTWANRHLWHIDHIVPLATAVTESDVLALNHFTNLRPIWAVENLKKSGKPLFLL